MRVLEIHVPDDSPVKYGSEAGMMRKSSAISAEAFDAGEPIRVAVLNKATITLAESLDVVTDALQQQLDQHFTPVWGVTAKLAVLDYVPAGWWGMVLTDTADVANALGYHDLTPAGLPQGHVFVKTTQDARKDVNVTLSHELLEMLVDPAINLMAQAPQNDPNGAIAYAYEVCDACEDLSYQINGINVSDFVFPSFFEGYRTANSTKFDYLNQVKAPFQVLAGGYMPVFTQNGWTQIFSSAEAKAKFDITQRTRCPRRK